MSGARLQCVLGPVATAGHTGAIVAVPAVRAVAGATAVGTVTDAGLRGLRPAVQLALVSAARSVGRGTMRVTLRMDWAVSRAMVWLLMVGGLASLLASPVQLRGQEIPLEHCDALPVIVVTVAGQPTIFLVDTAATSMLNLKSFTEGRARDIRVTSWRGTLATSAKEVTLGELVVGSTKLVGLRLPAIDLSAIGDACGRKIDGILGVDLIAKLGITIDLKKEMLHVRTVDEEHAAELTAEMQRGMQRCLEAFNESDEREFGECLDTKIVLFTVNTELYGREQVMGYFRDKYFHQKPAAKLKINEMAFHPVGEAVWYEYEFTIESALGLLRGKGMAMCRKSEGRWRMASMHHSIEKLEPAVASR
jgi:SnoaL-like domain/Aspartyl protease